jgi:hypothetical protein
METGFVRCPHQAPERKPIKVSHVSNRNISAQTSVHLAQGGRRFIGGYAIGTMTGNLTDEGFSLNGAPALILFAIIILYFVIFTRYLGGTLFQRLLGAR